MHAVATLVRTRPIAAGRIVREPLDLLILQVKYEYANENGDHKSARGVVDGAWVANACKIENAGANAGTRRRPAKR